jgi:hypothetical protein
LESQIEGQLSEGVGTGMLATNLGGVPELAIKIGAQHPSLGDRLLGQIVGGERDDSARL